MRKLWSVALLSLLAAPSQATVTPRLGLSQPAHGSANWDLPLNANFGIIDSSVPSLALPNIFTSTNGFQAAGGISVTYGISAGSVTLTDGLTASIGSFTATGNSQFSITTASGVQVNGGGVTAPFFVGNGAGLSNVRPTGAAGGDLSGTYPNPTVTHTQPASVDFSTITTALAGKLSNTAGVPPGLIDLSTVTTALAGKINNSALSGGTSGQIAFFTGISSVSSNSNFTFDGKNYVLTAVADGATGSTSGSLSFSGGAGNVATNGNGGPVSITGGVGGLTGGDVTATAGSAGSFGGGQLTLNGAGSTATGAASLHGGNTSAAGTFNGGPLNLNGGNLGPSNSGTGGPVNITGGSGSSSGAGGSVIITAGTGNLSTGTVQLVSGSTSIVVSTGGVSIGIPQPNAMLHVLQPSTTAGIVLDHYSTTNVGTAIVGRKARGTVSAPTVVQAGDRIATFGGIGYDGAFPSSTTGSFRVQAAETFSSTAHGTDLTLNVTPIGSTTTAIAATISSSGTMIVASSMTATEFFGTVARSSGTFVPQATFTGTSFSVCMATVTFTTKAVPAIRVEFTGGMGNNNAASQSLLTVLQDGNFLSGYDSTSGLSSVAPAGAGGTSNLSMPIGGPFSERINGAVSAGSHSWCLAGRVTAGTGTVYFGSGVHSHFTVSEAQ